MKPEEVLKYVDFMIAKMLNSNSFADDLEKTKADLQDIQYFIEVLRMEVK